MLSFRIADNKNKELEFRISFNQACIYNYGGEKKYNQGLPYTLFSYDDRDDLYGLSIPLTHIQECLNDLHSTWNEMQLPIDQSSYEDSIYRTDTLIPATQSELFYKMNLSTMSRKDDLAPLIEMEKPSYHYYNGLRSNDFKGAQVALQKQAIASWLDRYFVQKDLPYILPNQFFTEVRFLLDALFNLHQDENHCYYIVPAECPSYYLYYNDGAVGEKGEKMHDIFSKEISDLLSVLDEKIIIDAEKTIDAHQKIVFTRAGSQALEAFFAQRPKSDLDFLAEQITIPTSVLLTEKIEAKIEAIITNNGLDYDYDDPIVMILKHALSNLELTAEKDQLRFNLNTCLPFVYSNGYPSPEVYEENDDHVLKKQFSTKKFIEDFNRLVEALQPALPLAFEKYSEVGVYLRLTKDSSQKISTLFPYDSEIVLNLNEQSIKTLLCVKKYGKNIDTSHHQDRLFDPRLFAQLPKPLVMEIIKEAMGLNLSRKK